MRFIALGFLACLAGAVPTRAQSIDEILRTHLAAIGGKERVDATSEIRASGTTVTPDGSVDFVMIAQRPNLIRVESKGKGRLLTQVYDGTGSPYELDSRLPATGWHKMEWKNAQRFIADTDFDDPLVAAYNGRFTATFAGNTPDKEGSRMKILLTRTGETPFWVLLDPDTYLVMGRVDVRKNPFGGSLEVMTRYDDFRLVGGILIPHHVVVTEGTLQIQETTVRTIQANPAISPGLFEPPKISVPDSIATPPPPAQAP